MLARYDSASRDLPSDSIIVRLTADNFFPDGDLVNEIVEALISNNLSYIGVNEESRMPYGLSVEAFKVNVLREANRKATSCFEREHVTPWIKERYSSSVFSSVHYNEDLGHLRCTLDTFDDYLVISKVFKGVKDPVNISHMELTEKLKRISCTKTKFKVPSRYKNGVTESEFTLGTAQLGMLYGAANSVGQPSLEETEAIISNAVNCGINSFDCAREYGTAEYVIGQVFEKIKPDNAKVITKLSTLANLCSSDSEKNIITAVDTSVFRSCRNLRTTKIDTLLLHRWQHRYLKNGAIWNRLLELKNKGIIGSLGASVHSPEEAIEALADSDVMHIQLPYNILDWRWRDSGVEEKIKKRQDVIVHVRSVFLQGILIAGTSYWPKIEGIDAEKWMNKIDYIVEKLCRTGRGDLCLAYVRSKSWITSIVIGVETVQQLYENIKLFQNPILSENEIIFLEDMLAGMSVTLLDPSNW